MPDTLRHTETATAFTPAELKALRRAFHVKSATADEVCLAIRPLRRSAFVWACGLGWIVAAGLGLILSGGSSDHESNRVLIEAAWRTAFVAVTLAILLFVVLPHIYRPVFDLVVRPGGQPITMRGFGYEQRRGAAFCQPIDRLFWCGVRVDNVSYAILRRWWQIGHVHAAAATLETAWACARSTLASVLRDGAPPREMLDSADRTLWAACFGEAFLTDYQVVFLLPPPMWHMWWNGLALFLSSVILCFGYLFWRHAGIPPEIGALPSAEITAYFENRDCWFATWPTLIPPIVPIVLAGLVAIYADPWFRRAVAVIPRGQQRIQIRIGGRQITDSPLLPEMIWAEDANEREHDTGIDRVGLRVPGWKGQRSCRLKVGLIQAAIDRLEKWASTPVSTEEERHA